MALSVPSPRKNDASLAYQELVERCRALLRREPRRSVHSLAQELSVSVRTLNRAYKAKANTTIRDERTRMRLDAAASVLLDGRSVREAAQRAGYAHTRHLVAPFRQHFGVAPAQMRRAGRAISYLRWQARQPPPLRGSYQCRRRAPKWRAERRVLREVDKLLPDSPARRRVQRALGLGLKRPIDPKRPLTPQEAWGSIGDWFAAAFVVESERAA